MPDPTLILIDRLGRADHTQLRARLAGDRMRSIVVSAPWLGVPTAAARDEADLRLPAGRPWREVLTAAIEFAASEVVVVLDVSAVVDARGAVESAAALGGDLWAVAFRLLDASGTRVVFDGGRFDMSSLAHSRGEGYSVAAPPSGPDACLWFDPRAFAALSEPLLAALAAPAACGEALAATEVGWRLWLAGGRIQRSSADALVDEGIAPPWQLVPAMERALAIELDALRLLATTLEPETLARALALRPLGQLAADPDERDSDGPIPTLIDLPPEIREAVQRTRVLGDGDLFEAVGDLFASERTRPSLPDLLRPVRGPLRTAARTRVTILCSDVLGRSLAGPAIRALETARVLSGSCEVEIAFRAILDDASAPCPVFVAAGGTIRRAIDRSDALVVQGPITDWFPEILTSRVPIAVDLYDPMNLEALESPAADVLVPYTVAVLSQQIRRGDFFLCASERQRDYWLGMLAALGRITPAAYRDDADVRSLIDVVPFGIPADPPVRTGPGVVGVVPGIGPADPLFVWNGGLWDWFDPELLVSAVARAKREVPDIRVFFMGTRRPDSTAPDDGRAARIEALAASEGVLGTNVMLRDWTPYAERHNVYLDATAVVSLHHAHLETRFSFRTRLLDCLWAGVPVLCTRGDVLGGLVDDERLGLTVPAGDVEATAAALVSLARDGELRASATARLHELAPSYRWETAVEPLARWLAHPRRAPGRALRMPSVEPPPRDERRAPPPGSLKHLVPNPMREHVFGPLKRRLLGDAQSRGAPGR